MIQEHTAPRLALHLNRHTQVSTPEGQKRGAREDFEFNCKPSAVILLLIDWEGDEIRGL
jgi:hypothetical protein